MTTRVPTCKLFYLYLLKHELYKMQITSILTGAVSKNDFARTFVLNSPEKLETA